MENLVYVFGYFLVVLYIKYKDIKNELDRSKEIINQLKNDLNQYNQDPDGYERDISRLTDELEYTVDNHKEEINNLKSHIYELEFDIKNLENHVSELELENKNPENNHPNKNINENEKSIFSLAIKDIIDEKITSILQGDTTNDEKLLIIYETIGLYNAIIYYDYLTQNQHNSSTISNDLSVSINEIKNMAFNILKLKEKNKTKQ